MIRAARAQYYGNPLYPLQPTDKTIEVLVHSGRKVSLLPETITDLVQRYAGSGPRYTSYPTANNFSGAYKPGHQVDALASITPQQDLSLYLHLPFCNTICYYCACNKIVTANKKKAETYLTYLQKEIALVSNLIDGNQPVEQLHFGGGTPTYMSDRQLETIMQSLTDHFNLSTSPERDFSIEIDPRTVDPARIAHLASLGLNRLSLGIQDFDPQVQLAINRLQSTGETTDIVNAARSSGFESISVDLMYGLPLQSVRHFEKTLEVVCQIDPDRISLFNYAHMPHLFKTQRQIVDAQLPSPSEKLNLLSFSIRYLLDAGYSYVGLDHFAKPDDKLFAAQQSGTMHRNFQGYTTHRQCELIGLGVSAISDINGSYSQNEKTLDAYYTALDHSNLPVAKGLVCSPDDSLTRNVLTSLMCNLKLNYTEFSESNDINFTEHYEEELTQLKAFAENGLLKLSDEGISITETGRLLLRNIAAVFDVYLPGKPAKSQFSQTI